MMKEIKTGRRGTRPRRAAGTSGRRPRRRRTPCRGRRACADQTLRRRRGDGVLSAEISGTPRRTCTGSRPPRGAAPSRRRTRPSRRRDHGPGGRADGILSIPVKQVSLGSPRVGTIHVHAPTPHTPPLQPFLVDFSRQPTEEQQLLAITKTLDAAHATQRDRALPAHAPRPQDVL